MEKETKIPNTKEYKLFIYWLKHIDKNTYSRYVKNIFNFHGSCLIKNLHKNKLKTHQSHYLSDPKMSFFWEETTEGRYYWWLLHDLWCQFLLKAHLVNDEEIEYVKKSITNYETLKSVAKNFKDFENNNNLMIKLMNTTWKT